MTTGFVQGGDQGKRVLRDLALFMMEAARSLGLAARFVSSYLYDSQAVGDGAYPPVGAALPAGERAGWSSIRPNGLIRVTYLVRVAVGRDPTQAIPTRSPAASRSGPWIGG